MVLESIASVQIMWRRRYCCNLLVYIAALFVIHPVPAAQLHIENKDWNVRWDNSFKYSIAIRTQDASNKLLADFNQDDGNRNFREAGIVSNRFDILSEMDIVFKRNYGVRVSGAGWWDSEYANSNGNTFFFQNSFSAPVGQFTDETKDIHGKDVELLDAFAFARFDVGKWPSVVRVGRHSLLYGETLFFGSNGIAGAQQPLDANKLISVPGSTFKEIIRPVGQVSFESQISPKMSFGGYYQFEWNRTKIPSPGSFLSSGDTVGHGAEVFVAGASGVFLRTQAEDSDLTGDDQGQFGFQLKLRPGEGDWEYSLFGANYHDKGPTLLYLNPFAVNNGPAVPIPALQAAFGGLFGINTGNFSQVYAENIQTVGGTISGVVADTNIAAEVSVRFNQPLLTGALIDPSGALRAFGIDASAFADNNDNELFARGTSLHLNLSSIGFLGKGRFWDGGNWLAEMAYHRLLDTTSEPTDAADILAANGLGFLGFTRQAKRAPNSDRDVVGFRGVLTLDYFQVAPNLDLQIPIGLGFNLGASPITANFSFNQALDDRDFISFSISRTY